MRVPRRLAAIPYNADPAAVYLRWIWWRAALHRGWWLVTSVYLVADAGLSGAQLVLIGVAQAMTGLVCEIPCGAIADALSRRWTLVVSQLVMGVAMAATGLVRGYPALVGTQMLWGLSWNLAGGADVAWVTDRLADPSRAAAVLVRAGRAQLTGAAAGITALGLLPAVAGRAAAMEAAGTAMAGLGAYVAVRFAEPPLERTAGRAQASWGAFLRGWRVVRRDSAILAMLAATFFVNGAAMSGRLEARRLIELGFPATPTAWFAGLAVLTLLVGAAAFRLAQDRLRDADSLLRLYAVGCAVGALCLLALAAASDAVLAALLVVVGGGVALPLTGTLATIWVNRRAGTEVRATVLSYLGQAEFAAEASCGLLVAGIAGWLGMVPALASCGTLFVAAVASITFRRVG